MSRIFPQGADSVGRVAEQFFPRHEESPQHREGMPVKAESEGENIEEVRNGEAERHERAERGDDRDRDQEMAEASADHKEAHAEDVVMKEPSEAHVVEQQNGDASETGTQAQNSENRDAGADTEQQASVAA